MSIFRIAQLGEPVLRTTASLVDLSTVENDAFQRVVDDMVDTMRDADGVGIAAPQVFIPVRAFAIEVRDTQRYKDAELFPLLIVVNPVVVPASEVVRDGWEGCLSVN